MGAMHPEQQVGCRSDQERFEIIQSLRSSGMQSMSPQREHPQREG